MKYRKPYLLWIPRIVAVIFLVVLVLIYGNKNRKSEDDGKTSDVSLSVNARKTIVFSFGGVDFDDNLRNQIKMFMEHNSDVEVKVLQLPNSTDYQRNNYVSAFKANDSSIDVLSTDIIWTAEFANNGWVLPLDQYFTAEKQGEFIQSAVDGCRYGGKIYAVPKRSDAPLLYYRKDILPGPPFTYDEMIKMIEKYKTPFNIKYGYVFQGNTYEGLVCSTLEFIWAYGGDVIRDGKVVINSPEARTGLQKLVDMVNSELSSQDVFNFIEEDARLAFQDGNALFMRNWPYAYKWLNAEESPVKGKVGICELPGGTLKGEKCTGTLGGWNYMINRNSKYPKEAWRLIEWLTGYEMQVYDYKTGGSPPTRTKVYSNTELRQKDPLFTSMQNIVEHARLRPVSPHYPAVSETMQLNFSAALSKSIDVDTAISNIEKDLIKLMENEVP